MIELVSPLGFPRVHAMAPRRKLGPPVGRRLGIIWNQYQTTRNFWPRLEAALETQCKPNSVTRAYKSNTWMPLEADRFAELTTAVDYIVVGVGA